MDKSWITSNRFSTSYLNGVKSFIKLATERVLKPDNTFKCPCITCNNGTYKTPDLVERDLHVNGFNRSYVEWIFHGEKKHEDVGGDINSNDDYDDTMESPRRDELDEFLADLREFIESNNVDDDDDDDDDDGDDDDDDDGDDDEEITLFEKVLGDAQCELYPGCKMSLFSAVVRLLHLKVMGKWSNKSFSALLEFIKEILPDGERLPSSLYGALKMLDEVGLGYEEIDACKHDCVIFWKENQDAIRCPVCNESRWQNIDGKRKPHKTLRYFPLIPRLQKLFMFRKTASKMRWHADKRVVEEGTARHPADSLAWKHFDEQYKDFSADPRNVRLGLASDGFTPWSNQNSSHSMWPVILAVYNLPPYDCMKSSYLMLSLLIPGPSSPGKNIDVYLQPLIEDLIELWNVGIETFDISTKSKFQLRAAVLWTISDFPGYSLLSGWSTSGHYACPCCLSDTDFKQLRTKTCYMGHRRFLPKNHPFRRNRRDFNGEEDHRVKPRKLSGVEVFDWLDGMADLFEEPGPSRKRKRAPEQVNWMYISILFRLPYWKFLLIRHNLDFMHVEKNVTENFLGTFLDIKGKTKDPDIAREDLRDMNIREELHLRRRDSKPIKPPACYTLSPKERAEFRKFLKSVKCPDGFAANISKCVKENSITGLKSHDCHVLIQRLILAGVRGFLPEEVSDAIYELGDYFKELCSKTLKNKDLKRLKRNIPIILCKLEKIFPPYFFTIMVHLTLHLAEEAIIAGPVQFRWMYPIERFLKTLKGYIRNKACPEGSIAQGYIVSECLTFLSMYLMDMETIFNRRSRNYDGGCDQQHEGLSVFSMKTRPFTHDNHKSLLTYEELDKAHWYILSNCDEVEPYLKLHKAELLGIDVEEVGDVEECDAIQKSSFPLWFKEHINSLRLQKSEKATDELWALANGPLRLNTKFYEGCIVNEVRFYTKDLDARRKTQNSGVVVEGMHSNKPTEFFGFVSSVIELAYVGGYKVVLFQCEWFNMGNKKMVRKDKYISIDTRSRWYKTDPFVLPVQVQQVFFLNDTKMGHNWQIVQRLNHRHLWERCESEAKDRDVVDVDVDEHTFSAQVIQQFESSGVNLLPEAFMVEANEMKLTSMHNLQKIGEKMRPTRNILVPFKPKWINSCQWLKR